MLQIADVKSSDVVFDLGAGDGRVLIIAAQEFNAKAVGIEIRKDFVTNIEKKIKELKLGDRVSIIHGNFFDVNISRADVVTMFLLESVNKRIRPKLEKELKHGAKVVSHEFKVSGWKPDYFERFVCSDGSKHDLYLYIMPPEKEQ
ncbi:MAG: methyltransferase domain-containing protein [Candidatus Brockarchaeota archaeon]|nr:methyltransferase domain-containing protein [Candidatus Brockarchaeota archaeon]